MLGGGESVEPPVIVEAHPQGDPAAIATRLIDVGDAQVDVVQIAALDVLVGDQSDAYTVADQRQAEIAFELAALVAPLVQASPPAKPAWKRSRSGLLVTIL